MRRPSRPDAVLAGAVETARNGVLRVVDPAQVGAHVSAVPDAERLVTHRFEAKVPGYGGWQWFATLARVPRGKDATVCEVGLLPSEDSLLAPAWVPWAERVRPEDSEPQVVQPDGSQPDDGEGAPQPQDAIGENEASRSDAPGGE